MEDDLTVQLSQNMCEYRIDNGDWISLAANTATPLINSGQKISFKITNPKITLFYGMGAFTISKKCNIEGNIMSLLYGDNFKGQIDLSGKTKIFTSLFKNCTTLQNAENLILPATTLEGYCYSSMFNGCTSLISAPELPATILANYCYSNMFSGCTSLISAPELPATILANYCYSNMFFGTNVLPDCSNIDFTNVEVVTSGGLIGLFAGTKVTDTDLERILPKNNEGKYCLPSTTLAIDCYSGMFKGCASLTTAPELPATILANYCYSNMFYGCASLTTAPELPARTLTDYCYNYMFIDCSKLNYIKMLATDISASSCLNKWVKGVASSGTFIRHLNMTTLPSGESGIPSGWIDVPGPPETPDYLPITNPNS